MRLGVAAESLVEQLGKWLGLVPVPLFETHIATTLARTIMAGVELGVFECLAPAPLTAAAVAQQCGLDASATMLLLDALVASRYLVLADGRYALAAQSRKWLLRQSPHSVRDKILLQAIEWRWLAHLEDFVRTGRPLDFHTTMSAAERDLYHRSMRVIAGIAGREVAWRTPVPRHARRMLDLGGSHGHFSASLCRRHPALTAQVLDFSDAVDTAAPLLAAEGLGDRVVHARGDVTTADLGRAQYDLVFMSNLAHHLTRDQNSDLARRVVHALRPEGIFVIQEAVRAPTPREAGQTGTLLGLYFALQGKPGATSWTTADLRAWQSEAGLKPRRAMRLLTAPGWVQQSARA